MEGQRNADLQGGFDVFRRRWGKSSARSDVREECCRGHDPGGDCRTAAQGVGRCAHQIGASGRPRATLDKSSLLMVFNQEGGLAMYKLPAEQSFAPRETLDSARRWVLSACGKSPKLKHRDKSQDRFGSIASFWLSADYFRSSPANGHRQGRSPCLKGARSTRLLLLRLINVHNIISDHGPHSRPKRPDR